MKIFLVNLPKKLSITKIKPCVITHGFYLIFIAMCIDAVYAETILPPTGEYSVSSSDSFCSLPCRETTTSSLSPTA